MQEKEEDFEKLFIEAIDETVDEGLNVLAESGKQMLFFHLKKIARLIGMTSARSLRSSPQGCRKYSAWAPLYWRKSS